MAENPDDAGTGRISTDRDTIRGWADEHDAVPIRRAGAGAGAGSGGESEEFRVVRETDVGESHERVDWDDFFTRLDEGDHVVVYHGSETDEPFEVTRRDELVTRTDVGEAELEERLIEGETVTTEVTETTVVETVVVEQATIESELVDSEVVDQRVIDVELVERECTGCDLVASGEAADRDWFDEDRYVRAIGGPESRAGSRESAAEPALDETADRTDADREMEGTSATEAEMGRGAESETEVTPETGTAPGTAGEPDVSAIESTENVPYHAAIDVEEAWSVTRGFIERFTVESRVADTEVAETDSVEDRDIDVEGLHRSIAQSDLLDVDLTSDEVLTQCEIETEFAEDDRIHTQFERERVVEDEVVDRKRLQAAVTGGDVLGMETISSREVATELEEEAGAMATESTAAGAAGGEADTAAGETEAAGAEPTGVGQVTLTDDEVGKTVVDASGEEVGMVTEVEENGEVMRVDARPGITDRIKAALDWGGADEDDYPVQIEQIERVTDDRIELKGAEELGERDAAR